ncbi:hypothetical protein QBC37DRAFT_49987 [Rhypophila decipiens]|uniref:Uncharacterized protein n=1 Tax=Rhypophila decipiens TaxID=261697 RepID=A0AAN7B1T2_9PEZI|nr:hypothetical protein QBC37DRAFT_49987 [Rhypophila decipiens]
MADPAEQKPFEPRILLPASQRAASERMMDRDQFLNGPRLSDRRSQSAKRRDKSSGRLADMQVGQDDQRDIQTTAPRSRIILPAWIRASLIFRPFFFGYMITSHEYWILRRAESGEIWISVRLQKYLSDTVYFFSFFVGILPFVGSSFFFVFVTMISSHDLVFGCWMGSDGLYTIPGMGHAKSHWFIMDIKEANLSDLFVLNCVLHLCRLMVNGQVLGYWMLFGLLFYM